MRSSIVRRGTSGRIAVALLVALGALSPAAAVEFGPFTVHGVETVDQGMIELSGAAGKSAVGLADGTGEMWHVVYLKDGRVMHASRTAQGWGAIEVLSPPNVTAKGTQIALIGTTLHVVWEDARPGVPEIWTRRFDGSVWTPEECLTCDGVPSSAPTLDGEQVGVLAWQEGSPGSERIYASLWDSGDWSPPAPVSPPGITAIQPSVSAFHHDEVGNLVSVAWSDSRHGEPEIYLRRWIESWMPEERWTNLPGPCVRPAIHAEECCSDAIGWEEQVVFLNDSGTGFETWFVSDNEQIHPRRLSANDGIPSVSASNGGFHFEHAPLVWFGGGGSVTAETWTEGGTSPRRIVFSRGGVSADTLVLSHQVTGGPAMGSAQGEPLAGVLVLWTEASGGEQALKADLATAWGCSREEIVAPAGLLIAPEGVPRDTLLAFDRCSNEFIHLYYTARLEFDATLNAALTWAGGQPHPQPPAINPTSEGAWIFNIRGGGCSEAGFVTVYMNEFMPVWGWRGVRSPDVDGDCVVRQEDRDYLVAHMGTADFCADLDGSGLVDVADLAIVDATMGDICSQLVGVEDSPPETAPNAAPDSRAGADRSALPSAAALNLRVTPNPARDDVAFRVEVPRAARVSLVVLDAGGRCVRDLGTHSLPEGGSAVLWDARDGSGRTAAAGVYFVVARSGAESVRRSLILMP